MVSRGPFLGHKPSHSAPYPASRLFPKRTLLHNCSRLQHRQFSVESPWFARFLTDFGVHWDKQSAQCAEPAMLLPKGGTKGPRTSSVCPGSHSSQLTLRCKPGIAQSRVLSFFWWIWSSIGATRVLSVPDPLYSSPKRVPKVSEPARHAPRVTHSTPSWVWIPKIRPKNGFSTFRLGYGHARNPPSQLERVRGVPNDGA